MRTDIVSSFWQVFRFPCSRKHQKLRGNKIYYVSSVLIFVLFCIAGLEDIGVTSPNTPRDENDYYSRNSTSSTAMNRRATTVQDPNGAEYETLSQWYSTFPERIIPSSERKKDNEIRYAAFGTSQTWGATLADRDTEAYIKKLSLDHSENYAIRSSGPTYPAACTHSIMGDQEFDVIVMEWFHDASSGLMVLAQRLRERFPDAILVIARFWAPLMFINKNGEVFKPKFEYGRGYFHEEAFKKEFMDTFEENQWKWAFNTERKQWLVVHEAIAKETGSYILEMEGWGAEDAFGENGYLEIGDKMFGPDSFHLSAAAHEDFANKVKALVDRVGVPKNPTIKEFSSVDYCLTWFLSGEIGEGLKSSDNAVVREMPNTEKYGMEFDGDKPGWIEMTNPNDHYMYIFVSYMVKGPHPTKYPKTVATREDGTTRTVIDPSIPYPVHSSNLVCLGNVKPGATARISFEALEKTEWPFRIVQAVLTDRPNFDFVLPENPGVSDLV